MISLALAGKPNCGKSTFFKAATMAPVEIANYPFTTIDANIGVGYVRTACPCTELKLPCKACHDGIRFIPVTLIDVAGLVPDAHMGRGLGNQFLDNLRQANAIIHVIDASGATDTEGNPVEPGSHDPHSDIAFLTREMTMWVYGILAKHWARLERQAQSRTYSIHQGVAEVFTGLGVSAEDVQKTEREIGIELLRAKEDDLVRFCEALITQSKPMLAVGNRVDLAPDPLVASLSGAVSLFTTAAGELALRNAAQAGMITYVPGDPSFTISRPDALSPAQKAGLGQIAAIMNRFGGTGVQQALNKAVFDLLSMIVVYPVEDETHFSNKKGEVLPDAFLLRKGATPRDLAFQVHTEIGKGFLYAVDARTRMRVKDTHELQTGDIIRIVSAAK